MSESSGTLIKEMKANGALHLFSLYTDFPASICARWAASEIMKIAGANWRPTSEMWKLDSLTTSAPIRSITTGDAANADVVVVAVSSLEHRALELIQWLDTLVAPEANRPGLLIGLLGNEENRAYELDWTVKELMRCAQKSNRNFIWHWMEKGAMNGGEWLKDNVDDLLLRKLAAANEAIFC